MSQSSSSASSAHRASSSTAPTTQEIQDAIDAAGALAVNNGETIGNAIGVISDGSGFKSCNGLRVYSSKNIVRSDTLFEIGSVTKLLTTALFGSVVSSNWFSLDDKLSRFANGALPDIPSGADLSNVTLQDLATFA
ncbi:MAG: serine hydrolase domain-containing protein, partial [Pseudomonadota bacterium]